MSRTLLRFEDRDTEYFLEWSTGVDAPITFGMSESELREHVREEYGAVGIADLDERIARCRKRGTSSRIGSLEGYISTNRAGAGETRLTTAQIIDAYCVRKDENLPRGTDPNPEDVP